jgi:hypothetical protein
MINDKEKNYLVPTLCVGMPPGRSATASRQPRQATRSVEEGIPTQSVGTSCRRQMANLY